MEMFLNVLQKGNIEESKFAGRILVRRVTALAEGLALFPWMMERATRQTQMR